jgi:hypothetical protein
VREALIVLWDASDRICGKRLKAMIPTLLPAMERHGHLGQSKPGRRPNDEGAASSYQASRSVMPSADRHKAPAPRQGATG